MKKIVKILTLSVLAAALFVGCKPTETPTETPTNPDTNNGGSDTPVTTPADDENKDNTGADNEGDGSGNEDPQETVILNMDLSKVTSKVTEAFTDITYCSEDDKVASGVLALSVNKAWDGAFKISTNDLDITDAKIAITYKLSSDWTYPSNKDAEKCTIQVISKDGNANTGWKPFELSQGEFAKKADITLDTWKTETLNVKDLYKNTWDIAEGGSENGADMSKICAIKINTMDAAGTLSLKSIKISK